MTEVIFALALLATAVFLLARHLVAIDRRLRRAERNQVKCMELVVNLSELVRDGAKASEDALS